jgi:predicted dehydrogenase
MRFAIIGCGVIGTTHAETLAVLAPRGSLAMIVASAMIDRNELVDFHSTNGDGPAYAYGANGGATDAEAVLAAAGSATPRTGTTSHTAQSEHFLDAMADGRHPLVTEGAAARPLALIRGIYESAATRRPFELEEIVG